MISNEHFEKFGEVLADQLLPVIKQDLTAQVDVKVAAARENLLDEIAVARGQIEAAGLDSANQVYRQIEDLEKVVKAHIETFEQAKPAFGTSITSALEPLMDRQKGLEQELQVRTDTLSDVQNEQTRFKESLQEARDATTSNFESIARSVESTLDRVEALEVKFAAVTQGAEQSVEDHIKSNEELKGVQDEQTRFKSSLDEVKDFATANLEAVGKIADSILERVEALEVRLSADTLAREQTNEAEAVRDAEFKAVQDALQQAQMEVVALKARLDTPVDHTPTVKALVAEQVGQMRAEITLALITDFQKAIDKIQPPKDGKDGAHGRDGKFLDPVVFIENKHYPYQSMVRHKGGMFYALRDTDTEPATSADWQCVSDGVASINLEADEQLRHFAFIVTRASGEQDNFKFDIPVPIYQGVYQASKSYGLGDIVTYDGSTWIAIKSPDAKPKETDAWQLQTKRGADAKSPVVRNPIRGDFNDAERYEKGDLVELGGRMWMAKTQNKTVPPVHTLRSDANWILLG